MSELNKNNQVEYKGSTERNTALFKMIVRISMIGLLLLTVVHILLNEYDPTYPWLPLVSVHLVSFAGIFISLLILSRGRFSTALLVYLSAVVLTLVVSLIYFGGSQSPLSKAFIVVILFAGLLGTQKSSIWLFFSVLAVIVIILVLSLQGIIPPPVIEYRTLMILDNIVLIITLLVVLSITTVVVKNNDNVERLLLKRDEEISTAINTSEIALQTEKEARQHERMFIEQLQELTQTYITYLNRIGEGDYTKQLTIPEQQYTEVPELILLGQSVRNIIESFIVRIEEAETAQQMYIQQVWESFVEQDLTPSGFLYSDQQKEVEIVQQANIPVMNQLEESEDLVTDGCDLGVPLGIRGARLGAIGIRRKKSLSWTEDEVAMIRDIADQLTQTIERLRLVDDISRRAAMESTASQVTANLRTEGSIEGVLERALAELGVALQAERGYAQISFTEEREKVE